MILPHLSTLCLATLGNCRSPLASCKLVRWGRKVKPSSKMTWWTKPSLLRLSRNPRLLEWGRIWKSLVLNLLTRAMILFHKTNSFLKPNMSNKPNSSFSVWQRGREQSLLGSIQPEEFCRAKSFHREQYGNPKCHPTLLLYK